MELRNSGLGWMVGLCLAVAGCSNPSLSPESQRHLDDGLAAYKAGDNRTAVSQANAVLQRDPKGLGAMQALYLRGLAQYRQKQYSAARSDLEQVVEQTQKPLMGPSLSEELHVKALDTLGEVAYVQGDLVKAEACFISVIAQVEPNQRPAGHAQYRLGCMAQRDGRWIAADGHFQKVIRGFPGTPMAKRARQKLMARAWCVQVGSYTNLQNAKQQAEAFRGDGWTVNVEPIWRGDKKRMFLLQVGRWNRYSQAAKQLPAIQKRKPDAFLQVTR